MTGFSKLAGGIVLILTTVEASASSVQPVTTGMAVDTSSRSAVVAFWNRYYGASVGADEVMGWSGSYGGTCAPGTNSTEYSEMIERRINFYRALAGISSDTVTNSGAPVVISSADLYKPAAATTKVAAAQNAALMFSYAGQLSHSPPPSSPYSCWTSAAWNAAKNSNLAIGFNGPEAIDAYMRENDPDTLSIWNSSAGHRRWLLKQGVTDFASGDVPGYPPYYQPANVLYVLPASAELVSVTPKFVAWPAAGYFPDALMAKQWSLSRPGADFSGATVSMTDGAGSPVSVVLVDRTSAGLGDPSIIWSVPDAVAQPSVTDDTTYHVTVSGIVVGGQTVSHSYSVTVCDPDVIPDPLDLTGTANPPLSGANYFFSPVAGAEEHAVIAAVSEPANWTAGAEDADPAAIIDATSPVYPLRSSNGHVRTGNKAFRLVFPSSSELGDQSFTIDRELIAGPGGLLNYYLRRGYMTPGMIVDAMISTDGVNWTVIDSVAGTSSSYQNDNAFNLRTVPLPVETPFKVRFRMRYGGGSLYVYNTPRTGGYAGAFIDDVSFTGVEWTVSQSEVAAQDGVEYVRISSSDLVPSAQAGQSVGLRLRATLGGRGYDTPVPLMVTFVDGSGGFSNWLAAEFPQVTGGFEDDDDGDGLSNGMEYAFGLDPLSRSRLPRSLTFDGFNLELSTPLNSARSDVLYQMEVSDDLVSWNSADSSVQQTGGQLVGTAPAPGVRGFARWKVSQP